MEHHVFSTALNLAFIFVMFEFLGEPSCIRQAQKVSLNYLGLK